MSEQNQRCTICGKTATYWILNNWYCARDAVASLLDQVTRLEQECALLEKQAGERDVLDAQAEAREEQLRSARDNADKMEIELHQSHLKIADLLGELARAHANKAERYRAFIDPLF